MVTDAWRPQINGVVTTLVNTIQHLETMGYKVDLIEPSKYRGLTFNRLHGLKLAIPPYRFADRLKQADAVHIVTEGPLGIGAKLYCDRNNIRYTTAFHTNWPLYFKNSWRISDDLTYRFVRWFHGKSTAMMVPSPSMMNTLLAKGFTNAVHWRRGVDGAIYHPGNLSDQRPSLSHLGLYPYWLNVGRVSIEKNLGAFLGLDLPGTKIIVGDGPDMDDLKRRFPDVRFLGTKTGSDLADIYRAATVFVFPSRFDTFGLVMVESISCGTPVAAYPVTGPIDIVQEGVTGCLRDDIGEACFETLNMRENQLIPNVSFDWGDATDDFISHLYFCN